MTGFKSPAIQAFKRITQGGPKPKQKPQNKGDGDTFEIRAEIPGITKDELSVKIQGNYLEIRGSRATEIHEGYRVHRAERGASTFSRSFTLPDDVDAEKVEANLRDGILYLRLPKSETAKPKQITIG